MRRIGSGLGFLTAAVVGAACGSSGDDLFGSAASGSVAGAGGAAGTATVGSGGPGGAGGSGPTTTTGATTMSTTTTTTTSTSTSTGTAGGGGSGDCVGGEEQCAGGVHQVCQGGVFVDAPCPAGQGCDDNTGACVACVCTPGQAGPCADATTQSICDASCLAFSPAPCGVNQACVAGACLDVVCVPGSVHCASPTVSETCSPDGTGYLPGVACGVGEQCTDGIGCESACDVAAKNPSNVGCSFFALNMDNYEDAQPDAVIVTNPSASDTAVVSLYGSPGGVETLLQGNVSIPPLGQFTFALPNAAIDVIESVTLLRTGGAFRVQSSTPVVAYQYSTQSPSFFTNDSSCLLPETAVGSHYFVPSYAGLSPYPSYFNVVATADNTTVTITAHNPTEGGNPLPPLAAGASTSVVMDRYDTLQVVNAAASPGLQQDVMGAEIVASAPIVVFGGSECSNVPFGVTYCDHLEDQALPIRAWGKTYVGAHVPQRIAGEAYTWRVMARDAGTMIQTTPQLPGFPVTLQAGDFLEFSTTQSFVATSANPFIAVQYVNGASANGAAVGDPAMVQAVSVEQFRTRYVVVTPPGYTNDYLQIIRTGVADVTIDGAIVPNASYYAVGAYTVADRTVTAGVHTITSAAPFGVVQIGYVYASAYAHAGGAGLAVIASE